MIPLFKVFMAPEAKQHVAEVLDSGYIGQGPRVDAFERAFSAAVGAPRDVLTVNSGTSAIDLALHLVGVGPGDEVITTPMTCSATNSPIVLRGARPVWADIDPHTGLINPDDVRAKITRRTRAIVAVDWGGAPCDYATLRSFGLPVIQDAAHAFRPVLGGDYVAWSFQAIKFLTTGDGGALLCPDDATTDRGRLLRWFGLDRRSKADFRCSQSIEEPGYKYQLNDIAAAIGLANLPHVPTLVALQKAHAAWLSDCLYRMPRINAPSWCPDSSWWLYTLLIDGDRDGFIQRLAAQGVASSPVHARNDRHPAFNYPNGPLPGVDRFASRNVAIPVGWWLMPVDAKRIVEAVRTSVTG